ncbi:MAG: ECF transporter S component [Clostridia bacterium]|nr:ECF transporter S component [Clostridia bacterium]
MQDALPNGLYAHPFSKAYWQDAVKEFKSVRTLVLAALIVAMRVVSKFLVIRFGTVEWPIVGIIVNAFGSMCYGPVVAAIVGFLSDTLGFLTSTSPGEFYFPPAAIPEILAAVVFALFLYRTRVNVWRLLLSRFVICFVVNVLISTPITMWYYAIKGTPYLWLNVPRFIKNIVTFPIDAVILAFFFRYLIPPIRQLGYVKSDTSQLTFTRKNVIVTVILTLVGIGITFGYYIYDYNTNSLSANYTPWERYVHNLDMREIALAHDDTLDSDATVTIVEKAVPQFGNPEITYTVAVYKADMEAMEQRALENERDLASEMRAVLALSKSKAAKDANLTRLYTLTIVTGEGTDVKSVEREPEKQ